MWINSTRIHALHIYRNLETFQELSVHCSGMAFSVREQIHQRFDRTLFGR